MQFGPDDEAAYHEYRNDIVARFATARARAELGWVAQGVLDFKFGYLDGAMDHWSAADVDAILLELYPAKAVLDLDTDVEQIVDGFAGLMRFLGNESILPRENAERLAKRVESLVDDFRAACRDESRWSPGKRIMSHAEAEGLDLDEPDQIQAFMDRFNQLPMHERDAIIGPLPGLPRVASFPPVVLPPRETLEKMAAATTVIKRLTRLVEFVGDGRGITQTGNLKLADAPALIELLETNDPFNETIGDRMFKTRSTSDLPTVHLTYTLAVESAMLHRGSTKVKPGTHAHLVVDDPLEALYGAFVTLLQRIGPVQFAYSRHSYGWDWFAEDLDGELPMMLLEMYRHGRHEVEELAGSFWDVEMNRYDFSHEPPDKMSLHHDLVTSAVRRAIRLLGDLGIVHITGEVETPNRFGRTEVSGGSVELTPLGTWATQRLASKLAPAPVAGELAGLPAAELLDAVQDLPDEQARAEARAWIDQHPDGADRIVDALPGGGETARGIGFRMLLDMGDAAAAAVERLASHPELGPYATVWRVDTLAADADEMDCNGDPERFVRLLGAVIELWGPQAATAAWAAPAAGATGLAPMLDQVWRVQLPSTAEVLSAIGGHHPDPSVAKAARKALFKHRS